MSYLQSVTFAIFSVPERPSVQVKGVAADAPARGRSPLRATAPPSGRGRRGAFLRDRAR